MKTNSIAVKDLLPDMQPKEQIGVINKWFIENGVINDHVKNNLILFTNCFHDAIKDVTIYLDKNEKKFHFLLYMSRWNILFHSRKIYNSLRPMLESYLIGYNVEVSFSIYGKENKKT